MKKVRFATIGTSFITEWFVSGARCDERFVYEAVYSRDEAKGKDFAERYGVEKVYTSLEEMYADDDIDAVYVASPNACHYNHTMMALRAGKQSHPGDCGPAAADPLDRPAEGAPPCGEAAAESGPGLRRLAL